MAAAWVGRLPAASTLPMNSITASDNLHGFAKFVVVKKPAKPARTGINPFTKQEQTFAAKPASKSVRARPVKAIKDAVG
jgi:nucleoid DNA-binding protein